MIGRRATRKSGAPFADGRYQSTVVAVADGQVTLANGSTYSENQIKVILDWRNPERSEPVDDSFLELYQDHWRLGCFYRRGLKCMHCDRVGTHIVEWYDSEVNRVSGVGLHRDIVGYDSNGDVFLMTVDHIVPKSKGGKDKFDNLQPMCALCNKIKADTL
jgi:hypothetical protein